MCDLATATAIATMFGPGAGAATAAGATAAAATTAGATLQTIGMIAGIGGSIYSGISANQAAKQNAKLIEQRAQAEAQLTATTDQRERRKFMTQIRQQAAQLIGRGVSLDSPAAVMLGQYAGQELAFGSQAIRSAGQATQTELSAEAAAMRAQGTTALLKGGFSAASSFLTSAPKVWPELLS